MKNLLMDLIRKMVYLISIGNIDKNKCYLEIDKNKLGDIFILNVTRQTGDAYRYMECNAL